MFFDTETRIAQASLELVLWLSIPDALSPLTKAGITNTRHRIGKKPKCFNAKLEGNWRVWRNTIDLVIWSNWNKLPAAMPLSWFLLSFPVSSETRKPLFSVVGVIVPSRENSGSCLREGLGTSFVGFMICFERECSDLLAVIFKLHLAILSDTKVTYLRGTALNPIGIISHQ